MTRQVGWGRIFGWLLLVSLGLNLFLGGWAASELWHRPPMPPPGGMVEHLAARLPPADAQIVRDAFAPVDARFREGRGLREDVMAALRATPFDPQALDAALARELDGQAAFGRALRDAFVGAATKLSPEGRRIMADEQRRGPGGPPPR